MRLATFEDGVWRLPLTSGECTLLDEIDALWAQQWLWHLKGRRVSDRYARRQQYTGRVDGRSTQRGVALHVEIAARAGVRGVDVDHINGNTLDNRRENLRAATRADTCANHKVRSDNKSGVSGVSYSRYHGRWYAYLNVNHKRVHLGYFDDIEQARCARIAAEHTHFGVFAPSLSRSDVYADFGSVWSRVP